MSAIARRRRRSLRGESGLTLIEVIVSVAILAIIGGVIAGIFGIGLKAVSSAGAQARLLGAHDLTTLEQNLGQDAARAACVEVPPGGAAHMYGSCSHGFSQVACGSTSLCLGWVNVPGPTCHIAVYATGTRIDATKAEYSVTGGSLMRLGAVPLAPERSVNISIGTLVTATPPAETYTWVRSLQVTISAVGLVNAPAATLLLQPVATDPAGAAAPINGQAPC